jgi:hypothetical protein
MLISQRLELSQIKDWRARLQRRTGKGAVVVWPGEPGLERPEVFSPKLFVDGYFLNML